MILMPVGIRSIGIILVSFALYFMIEQILDLHTHSKYSRACSPALELPNIAAACVEKGIDIVSTGDFTHPAWFKHLEENLVEENQGVYVLRRNLSPTLSPPKGGLRSVEERGPSPLLHIGGDKGEVSLVRFILGAEISCIYGHGGKTRRIHLLIFAPSLTVARKFNEELEKRGVNLKADGRPIMGLSAKMIVQICLDIDERMLVVPAHAWTPWFAVFGSKSGYDSLEECFEELTPHIRAIETGLSSDPPMNHLLKALDNITLISNSDAHSLPNLGREANVFSLKDESEITYDEITRIIKEGDKTKFAYTIEFYPEEGMYHYDGHRVCGVSLAPAQTKQAGLLCPKCKKPLTVGVLHRVEALASRAAEAIPAEKFIPHKYIVPLREIIASSFEVGVGSKRVALEYQQLVKNVGSEFYILLRAEVGAIAKVASDSAIVLAIQNMRAGNVTVTPGYDGVYGKVAVLNGKKRGSAQGRLL